MNPGYEVKLVGKGLRRNCAWRPDKSSAMALWRTWMKDWRAGDRITVQDMRTGNYEVVEHG